MGLSLFLLSFGAGPSEAEDTWPTSLKGRMSCLLPWISVLGRNWGFERILLSCLSQPCEHKERDSPFFVSPFISRVLFLGHWHIIQHLLQTGAAVPFRNFWRQGWSQTTLRAQCIIIPLWLCMDVEKALFSDRLQHGIVQWSATKKSQFLGVTVNKRSPLFLSWGCVITGPVIR